MFTEDFDVFFDLDAHGVEVILNNGEIITGVFDQEYLETLDTQGSSPVLTCRTVDISSQSRNDPIEINGKIYTFIRAEHDGSGVSRALLEER